MKYTKYKELVQAFRYVYVASGNLEKELKNIQNDENLYHEIEQLVESFPDYYQIADQALKEIEDYFINKPNHKKSLLRRVISKFDSKEIYPFVNFYAEKQYIENDENPGVLIDEIFYTEKVAVVLNFLDNYFKKTVNIGGYLGEHLSPSKDYILLCCALYQDFFLELEILSRDFELDILKLQHELGITIWIGETINPNQTLRDRFKNLTPRQIGMAIAILEMHELLPKELSEFSSLEDLYLKASNYFYLDEINSGRIKAGYVRYRQFQNPLDGPKSNHRAALNECFSNNEKVKKSIKARK